MAKEALELVLARRPHLAQAETHSFLALPCPGAGVGFTGVWPLLGAVGASIQRCRVWFLLGQQL